MRPAQLTPENLHVCNTHLPLPEHFNEAGAINAGKRRIFDASPRMLATLQ